MTYISLVRCDKLTTVKINASGCCTINEVFRDRTVWATIGFQRTVRRALNSRQLGRLTGRVKFRGSRFAEFRLFPNVWNRRSWDPEILHLWKYSSFWSILNSLYSSFGIFDFQPFDDRNFIYSYISNLQTRLWRIDSSRISRVWNYFKCWLDNFLTVHLF